MGIFDKFEDAITNAVGNVTEIDSSIDFRNETDKAILVVMDADREQHTIAPGGQATFGKANVGDVPTFYVKKPGSKEVIFSRRLDGPIGAKASFGWNGSKF